MVTRYPSSTRELVTEKLFLFESVIKLQVLFALFMEYPDLHSSQRVEL